MIYDVIIVGAGPAGLTAAIYALRANKKVLVLEKETIGGKISSSPFVENYPGFQKISGSEFSDHLYEQVIHLKGTIEIEEVVDIIPTTIKKVITDENIYETHTVILASGSTYRMLGLKNEEDLIGKGVSFCTVCDGAFYRGKTVAVVGGGNSALTSALSLSDICPKVHLLVRKDSFKAEEQLIQKVKSTENIEIHFHTTIQKLNGEKQLQSLLLTGDKEQLLEVEGLFVSIGQDPETNYIKDIIDTDNQGYIESDENCETKIDGIYVAGDCRNKKYRQLTTAVNDGTVAALKALEYLKNI